MWIKWKDKKRVHMLTSYIPDEHVIVRRRGKNKNGPMVFHTCNYLMGGVDRSDQILSSYLTEQKRLIFSMHISLIVNLVLTLHFLCFKKS